MKLIFKPWGSDPAENVRGYPADYPRDSKRIDDKDPVPEGWIETTEDAYRLLVQSAYAEVAAINSQFETTAKDSDKAKLDALKRLFDDGDAIDDAWATATNAQKFDLGRIAYKILRRNKRSILEEYRPE